MTGHRPEPLAVAHGVEQGRHIFRFAPPQGETARVFLGQEPLLVGLEQKGHGHAGADRVHPVLVAVPGIVHDVIRFEDPEIGDGCRGLVLGPVHGHLPAGKGPGPEVVGVAPLGAGQVASRKAPVGHPLFEVLFLEHIPGDLDGLLGLVVLVVVDRQDVGSVHHVDERGRSLPGHPHGLRVHLPDHAPQEIADLAQAFHILRQIRKALGAVVPHRDSPQALGLHHRAGSPTTGLLCPAPFPLRIIIDAVQTPEPGVLRPLARGQDGNVSYLPVPFPGLELAVHLEQGAVPGRSLPEAHLAAVSIDQDHHVFIRFPCDGDGIEARELDQGKEVAPHVRVAEGIRQGGDRAGDELARAHEGGLATEGPACQGKDVLRAVEPRLRIRSVEDELEAVAPSAHEPAPHLFRNFLDRNRMLAQIDPEDAIRVSLLCLGRGVPQLAEDLHGAVFPLFSCLRSGKSRICYCIIIDLVPQWGLKGLPAPGEDEKMTVGFLGAIRQITGVREQKACSPDGRGAPLLPAAIFTAIPGKSRSLTART